MGKNLHYVYTITYLYGNKERKHTVFNIFNF